MDLILASSSRYRRRLLERLGHPFSWLPPDVDEQRHEGEAPANMAMRLAREKAESVSARSPGSVVVGSDQVASLENTVLGKPGTEANAVSQLARCSGKRVVFHTGVTLVVPGRSAPLERVSTYAVLFRQLSQSEIEDYVARDKPLDCAGSFKWESLGITLFERMEGDDPTSLEGLPLIALTQMLADAGYPVLRRS